MTFKNTKKIVFVEMIEFNQFFFQLNGERGKKCKAHELKVVNNKKAAVAADPPISLWVVSFNFQQT